MREYILNELWKLKSFSYIKMLQNNHPNLTLYIFGGCIRDLAHNYYNKNKVKIRDIDVFVDTSKCRDFDIKSLAPQNSLDKIDFFNSSNNFLFIKDFKSISDYIENVDFSINSAFFNMRDADLVYSKFFLSDIKNKNIRLLLEGNSCCNNMSGNWRSFIKYSILKQKLNYKADDKTLIEFKKIKRVLMYNLTHDKIIKYCKENNLEKYLDELFRELYSY